MFKQKQNIIQTKSYFLTIITFLFFVNSSFSQYSILNKFKPNSKISSLEIYDMLQDDKNYIWFATNEGVYRYDGIDFKIFTIKEGLHSNATIRLTKDRKNRIWFSAFSGDLCFYKNNNIYKHPLNDTIISILKNNYIEHLYVDNQDTMWIMPSFGSMFKIYNNKEIIIEKQKQSNVNFTLFFIDKDDGYIWDKLNYRPDTLKGEENVYSKNGKIFVKIKIDKFQSGIKRFFCKIDTGDYLISDLNNLVRIKNNKIVSRIKYKNNISGLFIDKKNNFWISVMYEGIYMYTNKNLNNKPHNILKGKIPAQVFQDNEGTYWFPTTDAGIFTMSYPQFTVYNKQTGFDNFNIVSIETDNKNVFFSTINKKIFKGDIDNRKILKIKEFKIREKPNYIVNDILIKSNNLWILSNKLFLYNKKGIQKKLIKNIYGNSLTIDLDSSIIIAQNGGYTKLLTKNKVYEYNYKLKSKIKLILHDKKDNIWLGTLSGLYKITKDKIYDLKKNNKLLGNRISDLKILDNHLIIGTKGEGLLIKIDKLFYQIESKHGLTSNFINNIFVENNSTIWVATNSGLNKIVFNNIKQVDYSITKYTVKDGLPSNEIKDISKSNNRIWLGTADGIVCFNPQKIYNNKISTKIFIDSILVNDSVYPNNNNLLLKSNQNNIMFYFKAISLKHSNKIKYEYKLLGSDNKYITTNNNYVKFNSLLPGKYSFIVNSILDNEIINNEPIIINFVIKKHFTQTLFVIILSYVIGAFILFIILFFAYKNLKNKIQLEKKLLLTKSLSLKAQMNPHFLYNSLNSIRFFLFSNKLEDADLYLTSFASLMRLVLESSMKNLIFLTEELNIIHTYLELEKMRFLNKFDYQINFNFSVSDYTIKIPPMIVQPFLENAIWHGLMPKKDNALLIIEFSLIGNNILECTIQDNGIGRKKSKEKQKLNKNHRSIALKNIKERIRLLNKLNNQKFEFKIKDLYYNHSVAIGTKVIIKFPIVL